MITSYDGFCTLLTFDQDELGTLYTAQASQINSPRMTIKPQSKTKKKKRSKPTKPTNNDENVSPMQVEKAASDNKSPPEATRPMEVVDTLQQHCETTPKRPANGVDHTLQLQSSLNNKLLTPIKEQDPVPTKRITPIKVTEVVHNRENPTNMIVIDCDDNSSDCIKPTEIKTTKRIGLTKVE